MGGFDEPRPLQLQQSVFADDRSRSRRANPHVAIRHEDPDEFGDPFDVDKRSRPLHTGADLHEQIGAACQNLRVWITVEQLNGVPDRLWRFVSGSEHEHPKDVVGYAILSCTRLTARKGSANPLTWPFVVEPHTDTLIDARDCHPEKLVDFGYRAVHEMTVQAKAIAAFFGNGPKLSYWNGCSSGGKQGLKGQLG